MIKSINLKNYIETLESGKRPKGGASNSGVPSLGGEHINLNGGFNLQIDKLKFVPEEYFNSLSKGIIKKNDILIVKDGATTGKVAYVNEDFSLEKACINEHVFLVRPKKEINPKYLFYYFFSNIGQREILKDFRGATVGGISKEFIDIDMYIPKVDEQIEIIKILDKAKSLIDKRKEQIKALDELVKSKFIEMFGDPIINGKNYELKNLDEICLKITDGTHNSPSNTTEGVPYVTAKHLKQYGLDFYSEPTYVAIEDHEVIYKRCNPEKGDVLYIKDGATTGIAGINHYDFEFSMLSSLALLKLNTNLINNYYLVNYLNNDSVKDIIINDMVGGAIKRLTLMRIKNIKVVMPPIELQNQFADFVKQVDKLKFEMEKSLKELEDNFNSLMQKAFKGELFN